MLYANQIAQMRVLQTWARSQSLDRVYDLLASAIYETEQRAEIYREQQEAARKIHEARVDEPPGPPVPGPLPDGGHRNGFMRHEPIEVALTPHEKAPLSPRQAGGNPAEQEFGEGIF